MKDNYIVRIGSLIAVLTTYALLMVHVKPFGLVLVGSMVIGFCWNPIYNWICDRFN